MPQIILHGHADVMDLGIKDFHVIRTAAVAAQLDALAVGRVPHFTANPAEMAHRNSRSTLDVDSSTRVARGTRVPGGVEHQALEDHVRQVLIQEENI